MFFIIFRLRIKLKLFTLLARSIIVIYFYNFLKSVLWHIELFNRDLFTFKFAALWHWGRDWFALFCTVEKVPEGFNILVLLRQTLHLSYSFSLLLVGVSFILVWKRFPHFFILIFGQLLHFSKTQLFNTLGIREPFWVVFQAKFAIQFLNWIVTTTIFKFSFLWLQYFIIEMNIKMIWTPVSRFWGNTSFQVL